MKGFSLSFVVVFLTIVLLSLIFVQKSMITHQKEKIYIRSRIADMNRMYESIELDINKAIDIITKRSISVIINDVVSNGRGIDQADLRINELMTNGTLNQTQKYLMENSTISDWVINMQSVADDKGYDLVLTIDEIEVKPYDSWNILITGNMEINISEKNDVANISRKAGISTLVSIEDFEDPLYALNTLGRGTNIIRISEDSFTELIAAGDGGNGYEGGESVVVNSSQASNVSDKNQKVLVTSDATSISSSTINQFKGLVTDGDIPIGVSVPYVANISSLNGIPNETYILVDGDGDEVWDIDNLYNHTIESKYYPSTDGASFLDRLEGEFQVQGKYSSQTPYTIGIESFVDKSYLNNLGLYIKMSQTNVDYIYFSNSTTNGDSVKGLPSSFKIDDLSTLGSTRQVVYGVDELVI